MKFLVETSARHVHLTEKEFKTLFGDDAELSVKKELSQPGQFVSNEKVNLIGPKKTINNVSILGPLRKNNQVEISLTDARTLGVNALVRESGDTLGTSGIELVNSQDESKRVTLDSGVIAAKRHIHATNEDAIALGVKNGDVVKVKVDTNGRSLIFDDVVVRVRDDFKLAMHIDTDESNACMASLDTMGEIIK